MDFGDLLHIAHKNSVTGKRNEVKCYSTKYEAPKKESKDKKLSSNIQKFLAKREQEEKEKARLATQKREELLAMRDTKAKNKINKMLKTIKSANKSVLDDAVDNVDTAVTLAGLEQPDEDDYGYVSQEASALYSKWMEKYKSNPDEKKLNYGGKALTKDEMRSTKDRVKADLAREEEEMNQPHRRQRQSKSSTTDSSQRSETPSSSTKSYSTTPYQKEPEPEKPKIIKKRPPPPPAFNFQELLKIAEQKQFEPIEIETGKSKKEPERLMTNKEKIEAEERRSFFEGKEKRRKDRENLTNPQKMEPNGKIPKLNNGQNRIPKLNNDNKKDATNKIPEIDKPKLIPPRNDQIRKPSNQKLIQNKLQRSEQPGGSSQLYNALTKSAPSSSSKQLNSTKQPMPSQSKPSTSTSSSASSTKVGNNNNSRINSEREKSSVIKSKSMPSGKVPTREFPPKDVIRKGPPPSDVKPRQFPPPDVMKSRQFPPADVRRSKPVQSRDGPIRKPVKRQILDSDEDEYDSELDDFIDDGPEEGDNYSKYISEIFGYDKSRYRDENFDDREMESTFAQQMREEYVSKKIGIMEDLEDMRQEALEKQKKNQSKKKKR